MNYDKYVRSHSDTEVISLKKDSRLRNSDAILQKRLEKQYDYLTDEISENFYSQVKFAPYGLSTKYF